VAMQFQTPTGKSVNIILLSQQQAFNSSKISISGSEHLLITPADVFADKETIHLRSQDPKAFSLLIFPSIDGKYVSSLPLKKTGKDGAFNHYTASVKTKNISVVVKQINEPGQTPPVKMSPFVNWRNCTIAMSPDDSTFTNAGIWRIELPQNQLSGLSDVFLNINYTGDIGRLYEGTRLLDDNFFNGITWEIGLKRFVQNTFSNGVDLKILPLRKDAPIYLPKSSWPDFHGASQIAKVNSITVLPEYEVKIVFNKIIKKLKLKIRRMDSTINNDSNNNLIK